ncbi:site-specific integrase [Paenibacillus baekrokdamisoli]|uniref:Site-specific integrase n=1 Tax=Paenibacillus baekrokdamisoli TaxID=1712516 RepID=A0A3G9J7K2_9BACL|nr:site-specific integrase [Paenibacillus baekrokdamisoli]MBB3070433.1 integrase [Paenibacillus baekrokdamisoli]BBH19788.1 site-specific integrase [Paenibacillus baekrokdamisoli]
MASFKKHETGWEFRIRCKDPFTQKFTEKSQRGFSTKREAQTAATDLEKKLAEGYEKIDISLSDFLTKWIDEYKTGTVRKNTIELHKNNIKTHIKPYFKNIMLKDIKPIMYQEFLNSIGDKGYSRRTVELVHSTLHNALEKAVTLCKLERNPCNGSEIKGPKKKSTVQFIESSDIQRFLQTARQYGYIYWMIFKLLIETGMRKGEAAALQRTDVDLNQCTVRINKSLDFTAKDDSELFGDTKTLRSERTIRITSTLAADLRYHFDWLDQNKDIMKEVYRNDLDLVLCREDGNYMPKSSLFNAFSRILKKADLPSLPIHSLRHTNAVLLLEAGADMKFVQEQLGHGSIQITSDVYAHISKKIEAANMEKFEMFTKGILQ